MRSMFFKRSRCWGKQKAAMGEAEKQILEQLPPPRMWPPGGARAVSAALSARPGSSRAVPMATVTMEGLHPRLQGNGPEPGNRRPARRNSALSTRQVFAGGGDREEGGMAVGPPPHPRLPVSHPQPATDGKTDRHTSAQHMYHLLPAQGSPGRWGS